MSVTWGSTIGYDCVLVRNRAALVDTLFELKTKSWQYVPPVNMQLLGATVEGANTKRYSTATTIATSSIAQLYVRRYSSAD